MSYTVVFSESSYFVTLNKLMQLSPIEDEELSTSMLSIEVDGTCDWAPELHQIMQSRDQRTYTYQHLAEKTHEVIERFDVTDYLLEFVPSITTPASICLIHGEMGVDLN